MSNFSYSAFKTIFYYNIRNYFIEYQLNILGPLINTILFVMIISTIDRYYSINSQEYPYMNFLIPGMVIASIIQTSFNHMSQIIISMKQVGSFNDYIMSPISRVEIFFSFIFSSIFVCFVVAFVNFFVLSIFTNFESINYLSFVYYLTIIIVIFSSLGAVTGFLSFTWDVQSTISNFFILPVSFFSGTFFSIESIDINWRFIFEYNPFYYLVNGFRSSFIESYKITFFNNLYIVFIFFIVFILSIFVFKKGYKVIK